MIDQLRLVPRPDPPAPKRSRRRKLPLPPYVMGDDGIARSFGNEKCVPAEEPGNDNGQED